MFCRMTIDFGGVNFPKPYKDPHKLYIGFVSVFSGCKRAINGHPCPDCQNPSLWPMIVPNVSFSIDDVYKFVKKKLDIFKSIQNYSSKPVFFYCVLGGEPLDQHYEDLQMVHFEVGRAVGHYIPSVLYTGYNNLDNAPPDSQMYVYHDIDFVKIGSYLGNKYKEQDLESGLATANQRWVCIAK